MTEYSNCYVFTIWLVALLYSTYWLWHSFIIEKKFDLLFYVILLTFYAPVITQYPFAFSELNSFITGTLAYQNYLIYVDKALLVTLFGLGAFVIGYRFKYKLSSVSYFNKFIARALFFLSNRIVLISSIFIVSLLFILLYSMGLVGAGGSRALSMLNPALRPIYNLLHTILPIIFSVMLVCAIDKKQKLQYLLIPYFVFLAALSGTRSVFFGGLILYFVSDLIYKSQNNELKVKSILKYILTVPILIFVLFYIEDAREGRFSIIETLKSMLVRIFIGNTFSDLRDFAWLLSAWDGSLLMGKTFLAGFLSFIPSSMFDFRNEWNWGVFSTRITDLDSSIHPGLRAGIFGETYFNFGILGVLIAAFTWGNLVQNLDRSLKHIVGLTKANAKLTAIAAMLSFGIFSSFLVTAGFFGVYVYFIIFSVLSCIKRLFTPYMRSRAL